MVSEEAASWSLTEWEWQSLDSTFNLAAGQPTGISLPHTEETAHLLADLLGGREKVDAVAVALERYVGTFSRLTGQSISRTAGVPLLHYSASQAIEIAAHTLKRSGMDSVALMTPTFDFIPALLSRCGLRTVGLPEDLLYDPPAIRALDVDAVFIIVPNNPTGLELNESEFRGILEVAAAAGRPVVCDFSLRGYGSSLYDQYQLLRDSGVAYLTIEDSGKWWPLGDLKIGMLVSSDALHPVATRTSRESLLSVPTVVVRALTSIMSRSIDDEQNGNLSDRDFLRKILNENRSLLHDRLRGTEFTVRTHGDTLNVEWIESGGLLDSTELCFKELTHGVAVLPGKPFFGTRPRRAAAT